MITQSEEKELIELYNVARIALGSNASRYDRMVYAAKEFIRTHAGYSHNRVWLSICTLIS